MENKRWKKSSSGEILSFPSTPNQDQDSDFEFGCFTPDSPSQDPSRNSPADHLFLNGRLLPHSFPCQQQQQPPSSSSLITDNSYTNINISISRALTSRTSSVSSKDSLMSSRSNSTNSRSSSCSSARTSSSDNSERRLLYYNYNNTKVACRATKASKIVTAQLYGSSQRWQHLTPVPTLKREASQRNKNGAGVVLKEGLKRSSSSSSSASKRSTQGKERNSSERAPQGLCRRFFMSFLFACRECHAMEPSKKDDILQGTIKI